MRRYLTSSQHKPSTYLIRSIDSEIGILVYETNSLGAYYTQKYGEKHLMEEPVSIYHAQLFQDKIMLRLNHILGSRVS